MKHARVRQQLAERQKQWDAMSVGERQATKRPGSLNAKKTGGPKHNRGQSVKDRSRQALRRREGAR